MLVETREMSFWTGETQIWACFALGRWRQVPGDRQCWFFSGTGSLACSKSLEGSVTRCRHTDPSVLGELTVQRKHSGCFLQHAHLNVWSETPRVSWPLRMCLSPWSSQSLGRNFHFTVSPQRDFLLLWIVNVVLNIRKKGRQQASHRLIYLRQCWGFFKVVFSK